MLNVEFAASAAAAEPVGHVLRSRSNRGDRFPSGRVGSRIYTAIATAAVVLRGLMELDGVLNNKIVLDIAWHDV